MKLRLCTFNVENLFLRHNLSGLPNERGMRYLDPVVQFFYATDGRDDPKKGIEDLKRIIETAAIAQEDDIRQLTALAMVEADADLYCLQEVDNSEALEQFLSAYYTKAGGDSLPYRVLHEGNDRRGIDVAALGARNYRFSWKSHAKLTPSWIDETDSGKKFLDKYKDAKTWAKKNKSKRIFQRDCLEIVLDLKGTEVSVFNCHFKSMGGDKNRSFAIRQLEAVTVHEIINRKFDNPAKATDALWAVVGDLNDAQKHIFVSSKKDNPEEIREFSPSHSKKDSEKEELGSGIDPLLDDGFGVNLVEELDTFDQWSLFYTHKSTKSQLDYVIASPALAELVSRSPRSPRFIRKGQPYRVPNTDAVDRYPRIGWDRPKASDHCPLVVEFDI